MDRVLFLDDGFELLVLLSRHDKGVGLMLQAIQRVPGRTTLLACVEWLVVFISTLRHRVVAASFPSIPNRFSIVRSEMTLNPLSRAL